MTTTMTNRHLFSLKEDTLEVTPTPAVQSERMIKELMQFPLPISRLAGSCTPRVFGNRREQTIDYVIG